MGQSKLKEVRSREKEARKGTTRLQHVKIEGQIVAYDQHGRAIPDGTGAFEAIYVMEADIPLELVNLIRKKLPKLHFDFIDPKALLEDAHGEKSKLVG